MKRSLSLLSSFSRYLVHSASLPPEKDPDPYEPNDTYETAFGPLAAGETITAYISWEGDLDAFYITTITTQPIKARLSDIPPGTDYNLYLFDESTILASSKGDSSVEFIEYSPPAPGTYWIVVDGYKGSSTSSPYALTVNFDGSSAEGGPDGQTVRVRGQAVKGNTGQPLPGGIFGLLPPGVTCAEFFEKGEPNMSLALVTDETDNDGFFELTGVPTGATYAGFFIFKTQQACEDDWLEIPFDSPNIDLGIVEMLFD